MSKDTIFTKIIKKDIPAVILRETKNTITILDNNPLTRGHSLVIVKDQIDHIDDCSESLYVEVFREVHEVTKQIRSKFSPLRVGVVVHGFEIPHAHVHVVPMYTGKEMSLATFERVESALDELEQVGKALGL
jgi:histidine triad (HIT) family protein